jgi:hypothetical protein
MAAEGLAVADDVTRPLAAARRGVITEIHGDDGGPPYLVRWSDGHESTFFPSSGTVVEHIQLSATRRA